MEKSESAVEVALRVRPLINIEITRGCREVVEVIEDLQQVRIRDSDKAFTYNYVFGASVPQQTVYTKAVERKVRELFGGYNVTILAYGQTGSGKTHSMGKKIVFLFKRTCNLVFLFLTLLFKIKVFATVFYNHMLDHSIVNSLFIML